jgi:hypothetical protein
MSFILCWMARLPNDKEDPGPSFGVTALNLVPHLLWFCLAVAALAVFAGPATRVLEEGRVSKVAIGIFEVDLAAQAVANIKDTEAGQREGIPKTWAQFKPIADRAESIRNKLQGAYVLWVDDKNPSQNVQERRALQSFGIQFDLASSTDEAFKWLDRAHYDAVISNVNRPGESDINSTACFSAPEPHGAGCVMAKQMHERYGEQMPPTILYTARFPQSVGTPPYAFGVTNRVDRLFQLVFDALERRTAEASLP